MNELKTIRLRIPCYGLEGCQREVDVPDYKILDRSLELVLSDDPHLEKSTVFGVNCPVCGSCYAFPPSKLKKMIIQ